MRQAADKGKRTWGPIQATRMSSRIARDGKSAIEQPRVLKKTKKLEAPKVKKISGFNNSFATLTNDSLLAKAADVGISLGGTKEKADAHVDKIKNIELERLDKFHLSNPDMFLPSDISMSVDEMLGPSKDKYGMHDGEVFHIVVWKVILVMIHTLVMNMMMEKPGLRCVERSLVGNN
jgi:hypothetical protein